MGSIVKLIISGVLGASSVGCAVDDSARALSSLDRFTTLFASTVSPALEMPIVEETSFEPPAIEFPGMKTTAIQGQVDVVNSAANVQKAPQARGNEVITSNPWAACSNTAGAM